MFHSLCRSASSTLQSFLYRHFIHQHFYRHFDTIHSGKPGDRIQATGYSSPQILCLSSSPLSYD